jgi:hypothetical protein
MAQKAISAGPVHTLPAAFPHFLELVRGVTGFVYGRRFTWWRAI